MVETQTILIDCHQEERRRHGGVMWSCRLRESTTRSDSVANLPSLRPRLAFSPIRRPHRALHLPENVLCPTPETQTPFVWSSLPAPWFKTTCRARPSPATGSGWQATKPVAWTACAGSTR
ncbi:hypothetical protein AzCIB_2303 [Azoarcus sp. CIB]|nr:hypothetical protein AzCIB_2303 [Azoarcus sp. CIB]